MKKSEFFQSQKSKVRHLWYLWHLGTQPCIFDLNNPFIQLWSLYLISAFKNNFQLNCDFFVPFKGWQKYSQPLHVTKTIAKGWPFGLLSLNIDFNDVSINVYMTA